MKTYDNLKWDTGISINAFVPTFFLENKFDCKLTYDIILMLLKDLILLLVL